MGVVACRRLASGCPLSDFVNLVKSFIQFLLFVLVITLVLAGLYAWRSGHFDEGRNGVVGKEKNLPVVSSAIALGSVPALAALDEEFGRVAEAVIPSVVSITARRDAAADPREELLRQFYGRGRPPKTETYPQGSGVIVSQDGHIVTNLHVVEGAGEIMVSLSDGRRLSGTVLGADAVSDIAVLKIEADGLRPLAFSDSEKVRVGQLVFAVGNPFGLQETITQGIISARERLFSSESINEFFQTDAPINPGNSGGPLVNIRGEIVGINNFIFSQSGGSQGIGFSIPANVVGRVLQQILQYGRVLRPYLGVVLQPLGPGAATQLGFPSSQGALVAAVLPGSPAGEAGIRGGDFILKFGGTDIRDLNELRKRVAEATIDEMVTVEVWREGKTVRLPVKIVEQNQDRALSSSKNSSGAVPPLRADEKKALSGVAVERITPEMIRRYRLPKNISGVLVRSVKRGSPAEGVLQAGDAIEQINETAIRSPESFLGTVAALAPGQRAVVLLSRGSLRSFEVVGP